MQPLAKIRQDIDEAVVFLTNLRDKLDNVEGAIQNLRVDLNLDAMANGSKVPVTVVNHAVTDVLEVPASRGARIYDAVVEILNRRRGATRQELLEELSHEVGLGTSKQIHDSLSWVLTQRNKSVFNRNRRGVYSLK